MLINVSNTGWVMNFYSNKLDKSVQERLRNFLEQDGAVISAQQNAIWRARTPKYSAIFYNTGKFLIQGADVSDISQKVEKFLGVSSKIIPDAAGTASDIPVKHIGTDESGKGDFFGPLVVAAVMVDENSVQVLQKAGVKDCKTVDDKNINKLAALIKNNCAFSVVTINPAKYNELYAKLKNLNLLLAWGHARAIENILEKHECDYALSDKFGDEKLIKNALLKNGKNIHLEQKCKAESDIAVAAASILARAHFLSGIREVSTKYGVEVPKGASDKVLQIAKLISSKYSKNELKNAAKIHFKTYQQI